MIEDYPYIFAWGNNPVRKKLQGKRCRVLARGKMNTVMVEFEDGLKITTSRNAIRLKIGEKMCEKEFCEWRYDQFHEFYSGDCGTSFSLSNDDGLEENAIIYCPKCGRKIREVKK